MLAVTSLPLWSVALVLAAIAPFLAKLMASAFERHARGRSQRLLANAANVPNVPNVAPAALGAGGPPRSDASEGTS